MTFEVDVRVPAAELNVAPGAVLRLVELRRIDLHPPAAGPEVELTFGPLGLLNSDDGDDVEAEVRRRCEELGLTVLAIRHRAAELRDVGR